MAFTHATGIKPKRALCNSTLQLKYIQKVIDKRMYVAPYVCVLLRLALMNTVNDYYMYFDDHVHLGTVNTLGNMV